MFTQGTAFKVYIKCTALITAILALLVFVFAPIIPSVMNLMGFNSFLGIEFTGETEKTYVNILLMGVDKSETLSDVMMVAQLNMMDNTINILQVPRDTYIKNRRSDKKLNSAYGAGGAKKTIEELSTVVDIEIDDYVIITTSGFRDVIDAIGGVYYTVPEDMDYDDDLQDLHIHLKAGYQLLDGSKAEQLVRFRDGYDLGDLDRIQVQSGFIKEAIRQIVEKYSSDSDEEIRNLIATLSNMVTTSFSFSEMLKYAPYILGIDMNSVNIMRLEGSAEYRGGGSYFFPDNVKNQKLIFEYFSPDISEADLSEVRARDEAIGKNSVSKNVSDAGIINTPNKDINVYIMDYSGTNGESLGKVRRFLDDKGYNVVGGIEARTCYVEKSYSICKGGSDLSAKLALDLGIDTYTVNPDLKSEADVVIIIGKDL
ncbi:MAG: LCP family protein [Clostridia bacterium]|nr:LCP family protein [Clostridia bacterium]